MKRAEKEQNGENKPEPKKVTSWAAVLDETLQVQKTLGVDILKMGGLCTAYLPYNEEGAVDLREAINSGACEFMLTNNLFNPLFLAEVARDAMGSSNTTGLPTKVCPAKRAGAALRCSEPMAPMCRVAMLRLRVPCAFSSRTTN